MPKIWTISDLHFERFPPEDQVVKAELDFDILIAAGDVYEADPEMAVETLMEMAQGKPIIFVAGNHDYWNIEIEHYTDRVKEFVKDHPVHFLEKDHVEIMGIKFAGTTLWPHPEKDGVVTNRINKSARTPPPISEPVKCEEGEVTMEFMLDLHQKQLDFLSSSDADVFVTHYPPPRDFLETLKHKPKLWTVGHFHQFESKRESDIDFILNPRLSDGFKKDFVIEVLPNANISRFLE